MRIILGVCCGMLMAATVIDAQRRVAPSASLQRSTVPVTISLKAGVETYQFTGQATCTHAPTASIYGLLSEQWNVEQSEGSRSLHLTLWKPKNGSGDMFNLSISSAGGRPQSVNTVKAAGAPPTEGSGRVTVAPAGNGGTFSLDTKTAAGGAISGRIKCDAFSPAIAEAGD